LSDVIISLRRLLAVSGVVATGGLSGCLSRVASGVTNTSASSEMKFKAGTELSKSVNSIVAVQRFSRCSTLFR